MSASYAIMPRSRADLRLRDTVEGHATAAADAVDAVSGWLGASGIAAPQGRADRRRGDDAKRQPGVSTEEPHNHTGAVIVQAECAELDAQCAELRPPMFGARDANVRSSTPWHRCAHRGNSEFWKFRISTTIGIL